MASTTFAFPSHHLKDFEEDYVGHRLGFPFNLRNKKLEKQQSRRNKKKIDNSANLIFKDNQKSENSTFQQVSDFMVEKFEVPVVVEATEKTERPLPKEDRFLG
jgi:hypothetical protein